MSDFLKSAVDKALKSKNGHLDLFLRFLLGLSLESNQTLLQGLLTQTGSSSHNKKETVQYIKEKIRKNPSPEKSINLFHCLNELNDHSLVQEVQTYLSKSSYDRLCGAKLSPAQWSALVFVLLNSEEELDEFDLSKYNKSQECLRRLLPVIKASRKAVLSDCNLTKKSCAALSSALSSENSSLRDLDLSQNKLKNSRMKLLSAGLENPHCKLEILRLKHCSITGDSCVTLCKALKSNPSHLRVLDLNFNKPGESGVKELSDLLENPHCKLEKLELWDCSITDEGCVALFNALKSNPSHLRQLNLDYNKPGESGVKKLSDLLEDPHCKLEKLQLFNCSITEEGCVALFKALKSNPSHLRELELNHNKSGESGVKELSDLLEDPHCKLEKLELRNCSITGEGCAALFKALKSSSHLRELDLSDNKPGESLKKELPDLLKDPHCKLEKLELSDCSITGEGCAALASALKSNPSSYLRELNLRWNKLAKSDVTKLCDLLKDPHCKLERLDTQTPLDHIDRSMRGKDYYRWSSALIWTSSSSSDLTDTEEDY